MSEHMGVALDLNLYAWKAHRRDLILMGTWLLTDEKKQPCMVIIRRGDERNCHCVPCVIPLERAWIWHETLGDARQRTIAAFEFCERLRLDKNPQNLLAVMMAVESRIEDLIKMPPFPRQTFKMEDAGIEVEHV